MNTNEKYNILNVADGYFIIAEHTSLGYTKYVYDRLIATNSYLESELEIMEIPNKE